MLNEEKRQAKLDQPWIGNQKKRGKKSMDRWHKRPRETRYNKLGIVD
jgi:hypothetical protein